MLKWKTALRNSTLSKNFKTPQTKIPWIPLKKQVRRSKKVYAVDLNIWVIKLYVAYKISCPHLIKSKAHIIQFGLKFSSVYLQSLPVLIIYLDHSSLWILGCGPSFSGSIGWSIWITRWRLIRQYKWAQNHTSSIHSITFDLIPIIHKMVRWALLSYMGQTWQWNCKLWTRLVGVHR